MRLWRCPGALLVERGRGAAVVQPLLEASRRSWRQPPQDYWLVDAQGGLIERFIVTVGSVDDELSATLFAVDGSALVRMIVSLMHGRPPAVRESVVLSDLVEIQSGHVAGQDPVQAALRDEDARRRDAIRQGEARIAAIPGARDTYDAGKGFLAAQQVLQTRVAAYDEPLSAALLGMLIRLGGLHKSAPALAPVLEIFADACRRAAFDRTLASDTAPLHAIVDPAGLDAGGRARAADLIVALEGIERLLESEASIQEQVDAMNNAAAFLAAARGVALARALLQAMLTLREAR